MANRSDLDIASLKRTLECERDEIVAIADAHAEESRPVTLDQQTVGRLSRMDAMQLQEMAKQVGARRRARLLDIDAALQRIAEGEYGYCQECGEDIAAKRLAIDPTAKRCISCAG